jgi:hypothetical protein
MAATWRITHTKARTRTPAAESVSTADAAVVAVADAMSTRDMLEIAGGGIGIIRNRRGRRRAGGGFTPAARSQR